MTYKRGSDSLIRHCRGVTFPICASNESTTRAVKGTAMDRKALTCLILIISAAMGKRYFFPRIAARDLIMDGSEGRRRYQSLEEDLKALSDDRLEHYASPGRVVIKVYRGPDDGEHTAHGYWVRQPSDDHYQ